MTVILPVELEQDWLDPDISKEHALSLLEPYPTDRMLATQASPLVNSVRNDSPALFAPDALAA
jgi:putative SOS response-associated peptidase YedK